MEQGSYPHVYWDGARPAHRDRAHSGGIIRTDRRKGPGWAARGQSQSRPERVPPHSSGTTPAGPDGSHRTGRRTTRPIWTDLRRRGVLTPDTYMSRKIRSVERINSIRETNGNFNSCSSCKRLGTSRCSERLFLATIVAKNDVPATSFLFF